MDMETTGGPLQAPIQVALVTYEGAPALETGAMVYTMRPEERILPCAAVVHGIPNEVAEGYPENGLQKMHGTFSLMVNGPAAAYRIIGYNSDEFDIPRYNEAAKRRRLAPLEPGLRPLDVYKLVKKTLPLAEMGNQKLDTAYAYLYPDKLAQLIEWRTSHDAERDCRITMDVLRGIVRKLKAEGRKCGVDALFQIIDTPMMLDEWPFGKDKGKKVADLVASGNGIVSWFLRHAEMSANNPDLVFTIRELQKAMGANRFAGPPI
jgi:DNA polymerase III epsilon subunit-like protein